MILYTAISIKVVPKTRENVEARKAYRERIVLFPNGNVFIGLEFLQ